MANFIPIKLTPKVEELVKLYFEKIVRYYSVPKTDVTPKCGDYHTHLNRFCSRSDGFHVVFNSGLLGIVIHDCSLQMGQSPLTCFLKYSLREQIFGG